jgi:hypothetical protein
MRLLTLSARKDVRKRVLINKFINLKVIIMKKLLIGLTAFMCLSFTTNTNSDYNPVSDDNIVYLYGETNEGTTVQLFAESTDGSYLLAEELELSESYLLELNPTMSYQLWFTSPNGYKKIIYVEKGRPGVYHRQLDISFDGISLMFFHMYQEEDVYYLAWTN